MCNAILRNDLKTKATVVKVNNNLLYIILQVNQSKNSHWNPRERRLCHPHVVRGAMHSGKKWRSALLLNAMHSGKKWHSALLLNAMHSGKK